MKKINIGEGGWPIIGEFLLLMQDALVETIRGMSNNLPDVILRGCIISNTGGTNYNCTSGWLKWGGEIFFVPNHNFSMTSGQSAIGYLVTTNTNVPVAYQNGSTPSILIDKQVKFKGALSSVSGERPYSFFSHEFKLPSAWVSGITYSVGWDNGDGSNAGTELRYRNAFDCLEFDGYAHVFDPLTSTSLIFTLPEIDRPPIDKKVLVVTKENGGTDVGIGQLNIQANGEVHFEAIAGATVDVSVSFCGIKIRLK